MTLVLKPAKMIGWFHDPGLETPANDDWFQDPPFGS